ncbi:MAG TPA: DUF6600 domain-containing protein [Puia sp.]|nr:DUF6600 domain-containing protein [Puia sp.]
MKKVLLVIAFIFSLSKVDAQVNVSISFQNFYDELSPYGAWVEYPGEGYVWSPYAGADFRPYGSRGHWVYTDDGWAWVSDYEWGWAPFHYGRWIYDDVRGWLWVPGYEWAPAWVTWGYYNNCYGWAPLGVDFRADYVSYRPPATWWMFVGAAYITSTSWHSHIYGGWSPRPRTTIINNTTIVNNNIRVINNVTVNNGNRGGAWTRGPQPNDVQRFTHIAIRPVAIAAASRPGAARINAGHLSMYRPMVNKTENTNARPSRAENFDRFRPTNKPAANNNRSNNPRPIPNAEANRPNNNRRPAPNNPPANRPTNPDRSTPNNNNKPVIPENPPRHQPVNPPPNVVRPAPMKNNKPPQMQHNNQPHQQQRPPQQMNRPRPVNPPQRQIPHNPPPPQQKKPGGR